MTPRAWALLLLTAGPVGAGETVPPPGHRPEAAAVRRHGAGYRYPQAGWTVLHVEGGPYDRGFQHGRLLAAEIAGHVRGLAAQASGKAPADAWKHHRTTAGALFLRRFDREYLDEMQGIADGASDAGAAFDGHPLDLLDVATANLWMELETLDGALDASPTGLEGVKFARPAGKVPAGAADGPLFRVRRHRPRHRRRPDRLRPRHHDRPPRRSTTTSGSTWRPSTAIGSSCSRSPAASGRARTTTSTTPASC